MQRFKNILFVALGADPQTSALVSEAEALVKANDADLTVYGVAPEAPKLQRALRLGDRDETVTEVVVGSLQNQLETLATTLGIPTARVRVGVGPPPVEVVREVLRSDHDLVIVASDGRDDRAAIVRRILRLCPCPVWVLRPDFTGARVLAAVDPDDDPRLNRLILHLAASQAERYRGELHAVHAWEPYGHSALVSGDYMPVSPRLITSLVDEVERAHRRAFEALLEDAGLDAKPTTHLVDGPPVQAITGLIDRYGIDLLVMGSVGRSGMDGLIVGNTAEQVFGKVRCSMLVVKPPEFATPVQL